MHSIDFRLHCSYYDYLSYQIYTKEVSMKGKMMRVSEGLINSLKLLKNSTGSSRSYNDIMEDLVHKEIMQSMAHTSQGYMGPGTVVKDAEGNVLSIRCVTSSKVVFDDYSSIFNGGNSCMALEKLSDSVIGYDDERVKA